MIVLIGGLLLSIYGLDAQALRVVYREQIEMDEVNLEGIDDPAMAAAIKTQMKNRAKIRCLYYNQGVSRYETLQEPEQTDSFNEGSSNLVIRNMGSDNIVYKDLKKGECISQEYILDKPFLIHEAIRDTGWVLQSEEKEVAGYICKKAVSGRKAIAWYCPEIPVSDGPSLFSGLPGLVLEVESGNLHIVAQEVTTAANASETITPPDMGRGISREDFNKLRQQKMEEMGASPGGGVSIKIMRK